MFLAIREYTSTESNPYWKEGSTIENPFYSAKRTELLKFETEATFEKWLASVKDYKDYTVYKASVVNITKEVKYVY